MREVDKLLTKPTTWHLRLEECPTIDSKIAFIQDALQQYIKDAFPKHMPVPQIFVTELPGSSGEYLLNEHTLCIQYDPNKTCTDYLVLMEHEREHVCQRYAGPKSGYEGNEEIMAFISWAVYPQQTHNPNGKSLRLEYAYNFNELRAVLASANWLHNRYIERAAAQPPDFFVQEKQELLKAMQEMRACIHGRHSTHHALDTNAQNARKILFGKYNASFTYAMSKFRMHRFLKTTGKTLVKQTMKDLADIDKVLQKDIKQLEKEVSQSRQPTTRKAEQQAISQYLHEQIHEASLTAAAKGFDVIDKYPTDQAYAIVDVDNARLFHYYMQAFPANAQDIDKFRGNLHWMRDGDGHFKVFFPKDMLKGQELDMRNVEPEVMQEQREAFETERQAWENEDIEVK